MHFCDLMTRYRRARPPVKRARVTLADLVVFLFGRFDIHPSSRRNPETGSASSVLRLSPAGMFCRPMVPPPHPGVSSVLRISLEPRAYAQTAWGLSSNASNALSRHFGVIFATIPMPAGIWNQPRLPAISLLGRREPGFRRNDKYFNDTPWRAELPRQPPAGIYARSAAG